MSKSLPTNWPVPESLRKRVGVHAGRQRIISEEGYLLVVLHGIPSSSEHSTRAAHFFLRDPGGRWMSAPKDVGRGVEALRAHVETFYDELERLDDRLEEASNADDWFALLRDLSPFVRTSRNLAKVLEELRQIVGPEPEIIAARDRAVDVERTAELVYQWANQGLDYTVARSNEEQARLSDFISRSSHRLNLLAAMTLPLTAVGSFFGVNLASGIETALAPSLFWAVGCASLAVGLVIRLTMPNPPETSSMTAQPREKPSAKKPHRR